MFYLKKGISLALIDAYNHIYCQIPLIGLKSAHDGYKSKPSQLKSEHQICGGKFGIPQASLLFLKLISPKLELFNLLRCMPLQHISSFYRDLSI
jgi:hypothetical protein